jgi:hypothetical protein
MENRGYSWHARAPYYDYGLQKVLLSSRNDYGLNKRTLAESCMGTIPYQGILEPETQRAVALMVQSVGYIKMWLMLCQK